MKELIYKFNNRILSFNSPKIMGILNVTPDSFSDGGKYFSNDFALKHAISLIEDGADIIDVGGESTRPGSESIGLHEEIKRSIPVIQQLRKVNSEIIISIDTTKSEVAKQALISGADIINDISGLTFDSKMFQVASEFNAGVVIMHIKGNPKNMQNNPYYGNVVKEVKEFLSSQIKQAEHYGINKIIVDPGVGFGKTVENNFDLIKNLSQFNNLGYPIMIGLSKKSFLGKILNLEIADRELATTIMETVSVINSAKIIRTHNVKNCKQMVKLAQHFLQN